MSHFQHGGRAGAGVAISGSGEAAETRDQAAGAGATHKGEQLGAKVVTGCGVDDEVGSVMRHANLLDDHLSIKQPRPLHPLQLLSMTVGSYPVETL